LEQHLFPQFIAQSDQPHIKQWISSRRKSWRHQLKSIFEKGLVEIRNVLNAAYDGQVDDDNEGYECVTRAEEEQAMEEGSELLFGEFLVSGADKALDSAHLNARNAKALYELGMGVGKLAMQAYLQFGNLEKVVGVELAETRFALAKKAVIKLVNLFPSRFKVTHSTEFMVRISDDSDRVLEFRKQNLFHCFDIDSADITICQTHISDDSIPKLPGLFKLLKPKSRVLTFENLQAKGLCEIGVSQLLMNVSDVDRFETTWSRISGHHFFLYNKL
jgi:hypothetical protein